VARAEAHLGHWRDRFRGGRTSRLDALAGFANAPFSITYLVKIGIRKSLSCSWPENSKGRSVAAGRPCHAVT